MKNLIDKIGMSNSVGGEGFMHVLKPLIVDLRDDVSYLTEVSRWSGDKIYQDMTDVLLDFRDGISYDMKVIEGNLYRMIEKLEDLRLFATRQDEEILDDIISRYQSAEIKYLH